MKSYLKGNLIPIILTVVLVELFLVLPSEKHIYVNFAYYLALFIFLVCKKGLDVREWRAKIRSGKEFWIKVVITDICLLFAFVLTGILEDLFPNFETGMVMLKCNNLLDIVIFALTTIFLAPISEELFFRKSMLLFDSKISVFVTAFLSMILFASEHAVMPFGILLAFIWSVPFTLSYILTKDIFVTITAHLISNFIVNGLDVLAMLIY